MLLVGALGCRVVDVPADLEELVVYGFTHFDADDREVEAAVDGLVPAARQHADALGEGLRTEALGADDIRAAGVEPEAEVTITGIAAEVGLSGSLDQLACALTWADMTEVQESLVSWEVDRDTDRACFLAGDCDTYEVSGARTRDLGLLGDATQGFTRAWRWVEVDGVRSLLMRELMPDPAELGTTLYAIDQEYGFSLFFDQHRSVRRLEVHWVDARALGGELPDALVLQLTMDGIVANAADLDGFTPCR